MPIYACPSTPPPITSLSKRQPLTDTHRPSCGDAYIPLFNPLTPGCRAGCLLSRTARTFECDVKGGRELPTDSYLLRTYPVVSIATSGASVRILGLLCRPSHRTQTLDTRLAAPCCSWWSTPHANFRWWRTARFGACPLLLRLVVGMGAF